MRGRGAGAGEGGRGEGSKAKNNRGRNPGNPQSTHSGRKKKKKNTVKKKKKRTPPLRLERFAKDAPRDAVEASNSSEVRVRLASCKRSAPGSLKTFFVKKKKPKSLLGGGGKAAPQI